MLDFGVERGHVGVGSGNVGEFWVASQQVGGLFDAGLSVVAGVAQGLGFVVAAARCCCWVVVNLQTRVLQQGLDVAPHEDAATEPLFVLGDGSDESFFGDPTEHQIISGVYDESSDQMTGTYDDVDPVSRAYEIWRHASDNHPDLAQRVATLPNIVYSTKHTTDQAPDTGVLVQTQTVTGADAFAFVKPSGQARRVTPQEALDLAECKPDTPPVPRLSDHHDLTAAALGGPLRTPTGRATGALQGVRGKVWRRLHNQMDSFTDNLLFIRADLEAAHDAMNERPLYEAATQRLANAVRDRSVNNLAALVVDLHNDNRLCVPPPQDGSQAGPTIVCTMGITG